MPSFGAGSPSPASYNGHVFSARLETLGISSRPIYDQAGRTVTHVVHSIKVKDLINKPTADEADTAFAEIKRRLLRPGQQLKYQDLGWGDFTVNVSGVRDVVWGPKPQLLEWKPLADRAFEFVWQVDVAVPECTGAVYRGALLALNFSVSVDTDRAGYGIRAIRGYYEIPQTRTDGGRKLAETADDYWEKVIPRVPEGYQRTVNRRDLSESKCRMEFEFVDEQMGPNYLPVGVVSCRASHSFGSSPGLGFYQWTATLRADYETAADFPAANCRKHFYHLLAQRVEHLKRHLVVLDPRDPNNRFEGTVVPLKFDFAEPDIYGRPGAQFAMTYSVTLPLKAIFRASGVWLPVGNDWRRWATSLEFSSLHPRGSSRLRFDRADDAIIDLCLPAREVRLVARGDEIRMLRAVREDDPFGDCPPAADSWLVYELAIEVESEDNVIHHKPLPYSPQPGAGQSAIDVLEAMERGDSTRFMDRTNVAPDSSVQRRGDNENVYYLVGKALRLGYAVPPPQINTVAGRPVVPANRAGREFFRTRIIAQSICPMYAAWFRLRYIAPTVRNLKSQPPMAPSSPGQPGEVRLRSEYEIQLKSEGWFEK